jgi:tether containing UBX domain for GLUT4
LITHITTTDVNFRAPLLDSMLSQAQDLPPPRNFDESPAPVKNAGKSWQNKSTEPSKDSGGKSTPKWFKMGKSKPGTFHLGIAL